MAKGHSLFLILKQLRMLLLYGVPLLAFIAYSGLTAFWVIEPYDAWRIFQLILLILLGMYAIFMRTNKTSLDPDSTRTLTFGLPVLLVLVIASVWQSAYSERAAADGALYGLLAIGIWAQAGIFRKNNALAPQIAALLAIFPLLTVLYLPKALIYIAAGTPSNDWHRLFSNIRMLDDALLPCIFLLWQRPAWLAQNASKKPIISHILTTIIYTISIIYFLVFWYDGTRAVLLSICVGLGFIAIFRRDQWINLRLPIITLLVSGLLFLILKHGLPHALADSLLRTGSSGRDGLWIKSLELWQTHPILGVGGDNFVLAQPWLLNGHPHNIPLQFMSEWGVAGLLGMLLVVPVSIQIFRHRQTLPPFAIAAIVAVSVDALFSGVMVYPLSQILGVWSLAWLVSLLPSRPLNQSFKIAPHNTIHHDQTHLKPQLLTWQRTLKTISVVAILAMLFVHGKDIICVSCTSIDPNNAPRFWQYGRALHLEQSSTEIQDIAKNEQ